MGQIHYSLVQKFKGKTLGVLKSFQRDVVEANIKHEDADLVLSTVHAAKGMEWWCGA